MLYPWPKRNDKREWIFHSTVMGVTCMLAHHSEIRWLVWFAWACIAMNGILYLLTLYCDYLDEKLQRLRNTTHP